MADQFLNAQVDDETELWGAFEEFREQQGYQSKSEAVREAVRRGVLEDRVNGPAHDAEETGLFTGGLRALGSDWYQLARDAVIVAGVALLLQSVVSGTIAAAVASAAVTISAVAFLGAVIGVSVRLMDAAGYHPLRRDAPEADGGAHE